MKSSTFPPVACITGAGSGIGRAVALRLSASHAVIGIDLNHDALEETRERIHSNGGRAIGLTADVTDLDSLNDAIVRGEKEVGTISATVSCAGVDVLGSVATLTQEQWQRSLAVNLTGVFHLAKATLDSLCSRKGSFTAIASDAGTQGAQDYAAYVAAKHGVVGLIRTMALDHGPAGVRSNVICPGFVETPMARRLFATSGDDEEEFFRRSIPLGRFATVEEIAAVVDHFVDNTYANGNVYAIDGGSTAGYFNAN